MARAETWVETYRVDIFTELERNGDSAGAGRGCQSQDSSGKSREGVHD